MQHLTGVDIRSIVAEGQVGTHSKKIDCDVLAMSSGYMPVYQLLCQAGAKLNYNDKKAQFSISGLPQGLHISGSVAGVHQPGQCSGMMQCKLPQDASECHFGQCCYSSEKPVVEAAVNFPWPIFAHPKGKESVDYDEDLQIRDIINATKSGYRDVQLVKRFSTVGMGPSQGRHSALPTARLVAKSYRPHSERNRGDDRPSTVSLQKNWRILRDAVLILSVRPPCTDINAILRPVHK